MIFLNKVTILIRQRLIEEPLHSDEYCELVVQPDC